MTKKSTSKPVVKKKYFFPQAGVTVEAGSLAEARKNLGAEVVNDKQEIGDAR